MEKRAQFYLLAAFVIVIIIIGLNYIYNFASAPNERKVIYDLENEASYEFKQIFNNMLINGNTDAMINDKIQAIIQYYSNRYKDTDIVVVYGDLTKAYVINSATIEPKTPTGNKVTVTVKGDSKDFEFKEEKNIHVIIRGEKDGEKIFLVK